MKSPVCAALLLLALLCGCGRAARREATQKVRERLVEYRVAFYARGGDQCGTEMERLRVVFDLHQKALSKEQASAVAGVLVNHALMKVSDPGNARTERQEEKYIRDKLHWEYRHEGYYANPDAVILSNYLFRVEEFDRSLGRAQKAFE